jgi:hypothetical protein
MGNQPDVEGKEDGPNLGNTIEGLEEPMAVIAQIGNSIPFLNPHLQKSVRKSVDPFSIGTIREPMISADHSSFIPVNLQGPFQKTHWS